MAADPDPTIAHIEAPLADHQPVVAFTRAMARADTVGRTAAALAREPLTGRLMVIAGLRGAAAELLRVAAALEAGEGDREGEGTTGGTPS
jgi:hypothetical protein